MKDTPVAQSKDEAPPLWRPPYWLRHGLARATDLLFPPVCPVTGDPVATHGTLAPGAWSSLHHLTPPWCKGCGRPFANASMGPLCAVCAAPSDYPEALVGPRRLDGFRAALGYDDTAAQAILALKYGDRHEGVKGFARLMARVAGDLLQGKQPVIVIPVPLHPRRLRQRRYNQAGVLAAATAGILGHPVDHLTLRRRRPTPSQRGASRSQRMRNVAGAFEVTDVQRVADAHILLIDDVLTTGATVLACARTLRRAGAASVSGLTLARVMRDSA